MTANHDAQDPVARIAAAIGERARARMLCALLDGHARTSTELAAVAEVTPSTASVHLSRLKTAHLVRVLVQGRHHYFSLAGVQVAEALESLSVLAGHAGPSFEPSTPEPLRRARTCYDHMAGALAVALTERILRNGWLVPEANGRTDAYELSRPGSRAFTQIGVDLEMTRALRRRFAYSCLDWSERRPHLGGALAAALLKLALGRKWVLQDPGGRALEVTRFGRREFLTHFGLQLEPSVAKVQTPNRHCS
jgi:DNA-binding transcriptional ArsR family regulator